MHVANGSNKARVLFVDDEKRVLNSMRGMFRRDFDLFLTTEGADAVKIAAETPIDVIVADQRMPGMSGIEVLGKVKELSPNTMRILLTGYADPSAVEGSINIGEVFRFLGKPCPPKVLRDTLNLAISATRNNQSTDIRVNGARGQASEPTPAGQTQNSWSAEAQTRQAQPASRPSASPAESNNSERLLTRLTSIGEVAFAWDSFKRRQSSRAEVELAAARNAVGVVLYTVDAQFAESALRCVSASRSTRLATSLIKVMNAVDDKHCGVLVTDISADGARLQKIISALKQLRPELVTIAVSDTRDTSDMVGLINHGQIFRFLKKPLSPEQLSAAIEAAVRKNIELRQNPDAALLRHKVSMPEVEIRSTIRTNPPPLRNDQY